MSACQRCREALSARADGEDGPDDAWAVDHLRRCPGCRAFAQGLRRLGEAVAAVGPDVCPDLVPDVLAESPGADTATETVRPCCAEPTRRLYPVGNAACGCVPGCGCGCQAGEVCGCVGHAA